MSYRERKTLNLVDKVLKEISVAKLSREEIVVLLGQLLIRTGYSIYFNHELEPEKRLSRPKMITSKDAEAFYEKDFTTGTTLMKIGFDLQEVLLQRKTKDKGK